MDEFISNKYPTHTEIKVNIDLDTENAQKLKSYALKIIEDGETNILFDIEEVEKISSEGIGVLIYIFQKVRKKDGDIKFVYMHPTISGILEKLRLTRVFEIYNDIKYARRCFEIDSI